MSTGLDSLHKILQDPTRRKMLLLLNQKGEVTYTEFLEGTGARTGTLNYHLKVLGELLSKNESGKYTLTEKGKVASDLMLQFPEWKKSKHQWNRVTLIIEIIVPLIIIVILTLLYLAGVGTWNIFSLMYVILSVFFMMIIVLCYLMIFRPQKPNSIYGYICSVNDGFESLNKILKDETRRKILLLINTKKEVNYTDLMEKTGVSSTGPLNYHLKVLFELVTKNEDGQFRLSEKGKAACNYMLEFPEMDNSDQRKKWAARYKRSFFLAPIILWPLDFILYYLGAINLELAFLIGFGAPLYMIIEYLLLRRQISTLEQDEFSRTIKDTKVCGRSLSEVKEEVHKWINSEKNTVDIERDDYIKGRLGLKKRFAEMNTIFYEVSLDQEQDGIMVHTEGWVDLGYAERDFLEDSISFIDDNYGYDKFRRKSWDAISKLWIRLETMSK
jgi:DNA-binding transcriptional ArsR family regulator